ncbi:MAG: FAD-dependent oxidoreductase, partial [Sciscionella sp.]
MSNDRHAVVVGGGIGGLAAAIGLRRAGWRATVVERGTGFTGIGAGISLMRNALLAMDALGLGAAVGELPRNYGSGSVRSRTGALLGHSPESHARDAPLLEMVLLHRAELHGLLRAALPQQWLVAGTEVTRVDDLNSHDLNSHDPHGKVRLRTTDGDIEDAELVVAADGVGSRLRTQLWPHHPGAVYS